MCIQYYLHELKRLKYATATNRSAELYYKKCALVAVDNAMDALGFLPYGLDYLQLIDYWEGVKQEIKKL